MFRNNVRLKVSLIMRKNTGLTLTFLIFALVVPFTVQYKPIIFMHGIIGSPTEAEYLISILQKVKMHSIMSMFVLYIPPEIGAPPLIMFNVNVCL